MPAPKRRRWFSLSLRTLLIGMTLLSVVFAWFLHHRRGKIAERERLLKRYGGPTDSLEQHRPAVELEFSDILAGWKLPKPPAKKRDAWWLLRALAAPRLEAVDLYLEVSRPPTDEAVELARNVPCLRLRSRRLPPRSLEQLVSAETRELYIYPAVSPDELAAIVQAPNLRVLSIKPADDAWVHSDCRWLQSCENLTEIYAECREPAFLQQLGAQRGGVERLHMIRANQAVLDGLNQWSRLRYLSIEYLRLDDQMLQALPAVGSQLERLEIYHCDARALTPTSLAALQQCSGLRVLELGDCQLSRQHLEALAELSQLHDLSLRTQHLSPADLAPLRRSPQLNLIDLDDKQD